MTHLCGAQPFPTSGGQLSCPVVVLSTASALSNGGGSCCMLRSISLYHGILFVDVLDDPVGERCTYSSFRLRLTSTMARPPAHPLSFPSSPICMSQKHTDMLTLFAPTHLSWTDWGQSVFKVGRRCMVTIRFWVGIRTHTRYLLPLHIYAWPSTQDLPLPFDPCKYTPFQATAPSGQFYL